MMNTHKTTPQKAPASAMRQRNYTEVIEFLEARWAEESQTSSLETIKQLDKALGTLSKQIDTILVAGTNGKALTLEFCGKLLKEEGIKTGVFYHEHLLTYNERIAYHGEAISNKAFTDVANEVINTAESHDIAASTRELLTMMALLFFKQSGAEVALLGVSQGGTWDPVNICDAKVVAVTRIPSDSASQAPHDVDREKVEDVMGVVKPGCWVVSADQSKLNLQTMLELTEAKGASWAMPIRKLVALDYPFEQLQGRHAALAERAAQLYVQNYIQTSDTVVTDSLLMRQKGQRGRPTLEAKRQAELHPKRTLEDFWKEVKSELPGRFQCLDREKPTILIDNARNIDALKNLLLGVRLLHYQRPLKGLTLVMAANKDEMITEEFLKLIRYFFKKTAGQIIVCPVPHAVPEQMYHDAWEVEKITNDIKSLKIKAKSALTFREAFEMAKSSVDERNGLVVVAGSQAIAAEYWNYKGAKKF